MMLHETGIKAQRDRAMLVASYRDMSKEFRVPRRERLTAAQIAKMTNKMLHRACRDLYNGVTVAEARKYGIKRGFIAAPKKKSWAIALKRILFGRDTDYEMQRAASHA